MSRVGRTGSPNDPQCESPLTVTMNPVNQQRRHDAVNQRKGRGKSVIWCLCDWTESESFILGVCASRQVIMVCLGLNNI